MRYITDYILRGRKQATIAALVATLIPFMGWFGVVIMTFVTLRSGIKEGFLILLWVMLPALALTISAPTWFSFSNLFYSYFVVFGLAIILRETGSWALVIEVAALIGLSAVAITHFVNPDIAGWWFERINSYINDRGLLVSLGLDQTSVTSTAHFIAGIATGLEIVALLVNGMINLLIARGMQTALSIRGGLRQELYQIKLGYVCTALLVAVLIGTTMHLAMAMDMLPVLSMLFVLAGIALVHYLADLSKSAWVWLVAFYISFVGLLPYTLAVVILIALTDSWFNIRKRLQQAVIKT